MRPVNPYTPGAGSMPKYLAGRDTMLENAHRYLTNVKLGYPQNSVIYYGLRGVGKTVLLNKIEEYADDLGILYKHIEASGDKRFTQRLVSTIGQFANDISLTSKIKDIAKKCFSLLQTFKVTYSPVDGSIEAGIDASFSPLGATGIYDEDLTEVFVELGKLASKTSSTICFFIDEMQYLSATEISGLLSSLHRCTQLRLPIVLFCAGLPKIRKAVGEAKSYSERLFSFVSVSRLDPLSAEKAIVEPAIELGVRYEEPAIKEILEATDGYPYFIQEFCNIVWDNTSEETITFRDVATSKSEFLANLDGGFFSVRYERCSHAEKNFMTAMVKCGELPCTISNVASILGKSVKSISPVRGRLINKGMIFSTGHAEIDFTVPQFDGFIKRINPSLEIN